MDHAGIRILYSNRCERRGLRNVNMRLSEIALKAKRNEREGSNQQAPSARIPGTIVHHGCAASLQNLARVILAARN